MEVPLEMPELEDLLLHQEPNIENKETYSNNLLA
jgi:hypothetical protein